MDRLIIPTGALPQAKAEPAWWFIFSAGKLLAAPNGTSFSVPFVDDPASLGLTPIREKYLGILDGRHCFRAEIAKDAPVPPGMGLYGLRYLFGRLPEALHAVAVRTMHLTAWEGTARYCGRCGHETAPGAELNALQCPGCGLTAFPKISPAVIVLVERDGKMLLARGRRFALPFYSVLAGFVEPGESLEDTVHREIGEEVGIRVKNIRYFGSQPWPYPDSLMIGFTAEYAGGEIREDPEEIVDAGWFAPDDLPPVPGKVSIARKLIDWFIEKETKGKGPLPAIPERAYDPGE